MKVLIVDDEAPARERLRSLLAEVPGCRIVGEAASGRQALEQVHAGDPDVVFLDIRMPVMDGLETARHLSGLAQPPAVIFTTAYDRHALEAFETAAVDYLLKPVRRSRLEQALERARRPNRVQLQTLHGAAPNGARSHICASSRGSLEVVPVSDIAYFLADHKYVTVRYGGGELLIEDSLRSLEEEFGSAFIRIHRNALVAAARLEAVEKGPDGRQLARLRDVGERLEISRRHVPEVRRFLRGRR